jgi:hypothetical protein
MGYDYSKTQDGFMSELLWLYFDTNEGDIMVDNEVRKHVLRF